MLPACGSQQAVGHQNRGQQGCGGAAPFQERGNMHSSSSSSSSSTRPEDAMLLLTSQHWLTRRRGVADQHAGCVASIAFELALAAQGGVLPPQERHDSSRDLLHQLQRRPMLLSCSDRLKVAPQVAQHKHSMLCQCRVVTADGVASGRPGSGQCISRLAWLQAADNWRGFRVARMCR
jgi:hypothetical protein